MQSLLEEIKNKSTSMSVANISINEIKKLQIPLPSLEEQQRIVDEIERIETVKENCENMIKDYEPHVVLNSERSRHSLKDIVDFDPTKPSDLSDDMNVSFVPMAIVQEHQKSFFPQEIKKVHEVKK